MRSLKATTSLLGWGWSTGDRTILGKISKRGKRYPRVQAARVVLIKPKSWNRHGIKPWLEAANTVAKYFEHPSAKH